MFEQNQSFCRHGVGWQLPCAGNLLDIEISPIRRTSMYVARTNTYDIKQAHRCGSVGDHVNFRATFRSQPSMVSCIIWQRIELQNVVPIIRWLQINKVTWRISHMVYNYRDEINSFRDGLHVWVEGASTHLAVGRRADIHRVTRWRSE